MKRTLLFICTLLAFAGSTFADDSFSVDNVTLPQNGEADVVVRFSLDEGSTCSGYTFWLQVPEELAFVTYEKNGKTNITFTAGDCYDETPTITPNIDGGYLKVGCLTANSDPINGPTGTLVTFRLKVVGAVEVGDVLTGTLLKGTISAENGTVHDVDDATFTITIDEPDDGRIKFDENATVLPTYTIGDKCNVRMTRTIHANQWSTIVLPFTLTKAKAEAAFGSDMQLAEFAGFEVDYGDDEENVVPLGITVNFNSYTLTAKKSMTGGKPFLIKTTKDIESIEADECSMVGGITNVTKADEYDTPGIFTGSLVKTIVPEDGLFISNERFYYSTGKTNIKAFRGWFELGAVLDKETSFDVKMAVFLDDEETHVEGINGEQQTTDAVYDLGGRKVTKLQQHGVYIINGKKILK
ncbi:MAG: hypothetical protein IJT11_07355 [Bacteroidaceae bacterium]|nr:hypothetical protein [Bacteroidaceae bacterium]